MAPRNHIAGLAFCLLAVNAAAALLAVAAEEGEVNTQPKVAIAALIYGLKGN